MIHFQNPKDWSKQNVRGIIKFFMNEQDYKYQSEFKSFTEKLDDIRKQDVKTVFPELKEYFDIINLH